MSSSRELLSVGIDVGTTTTQVVFSDLVVRDSARLGAIPRLEIDTRSIRYTSEPHETPLLAPDRIAVDALVELVRSDYAAAGVDPAQVDTGAVIITGETARAENADAILTGMSDLAGDFVVTVAGPNIEAQMAGRGSGAAAWSADRYTKVINVDIGGGSANAAVFHLGRHLASAALEVGGRQVQVDGDGTVVHLAPPGQAIAAALGLHLTPGTRTTVAELRRLCEAMANCIVDLLHGAPSPSYQGVALTPPLRHADGATAVFLSGGVGWCYHEDLPAGTMAEVTRFGDVGPLLARALHEHPGLVGLDVRRPSQDLRATVLGAASQTVTLSGSTIWAAGELLPLRNLPVVEPAPATELSSADLADAIRLAAARWDASDRTVAVALDVPPRTTYDQLTTIADAVVVVSRQLPAGRPLVLVTQHDVAKALGQTINGRRPELPLVAIDQIGLGEGDFIDIGTPILDGRVVPVSVKTLVFTQ